MSHSIGSLIEWHILLAEEDYRNIGKFVEDYLQPSSLSDIEVFRCAALPPGDMCYLKINHWLDCHDIKSDYWYLVLADDNMVGPRSTGGITEHSHDDSGCHLLMPSRAAAG